MKTLRIGYIPLVDAATLIAAVERGFAEQENLRLELVREVSWANIRDKLILEMLDATHMLAPLAVATSLGLGHVKVPLCVPFAINANGSCITLASTLFAELTEMLGHEPANGLESAKALGQLVKSRKKKGSEPLSFGIVFPFSIHSVLIRHWLRWGGIDADNDVQFVVVPPPYMAAGLSNGLIQGCCVGNPWNSMAVAAGVGCIAAFGSEIARRGPDKVLALRQSSAKKDPETLTQLLRALSHAAAWCENAGNRDELATIMARPDYLNVPKGAIRETLGGNLRTSPKASRADGNFLILGREGVNRPDPRHARWIYAEAVHANHLQISENAARAAAAVYCPDLYDAAIPTKIPATANDPIGLMQGPAFDGTDLDGYVRALSTRIA